ncbi:MAG: hypothetical protein ACTSRP_00715 [Candidatus Helarchaeota archaeon]
MKSKNFTKFFTLIEDDIKDKIREIHYIRKLRIDFFNGNDNDIFLVNYQSENDEFLNIISSIINNLNIKIVRLKDSNQYYFLLEKDYGLLLVSFFDASVFFIPKICLKCENLGCLETFRKICIVLKDDGYTNINLSKLEIELMSKLLILSNDKLIPVEIITSIMSKQSCTNLYERKKIKKILFKVFKKLQKIFKIENVLICSVNGSIVNYIYYKNFYPINISLISAIALAQIKLNQLLLTILNGDKDNLNFNLIFTKKKTICSFQISGGFLIILQLSVPLKPKDICLLENSVAKIKNKIRDLFYS